MEGMEEVEGVGGVEGREEGEGRKELLDVQAAKGGAALYVELTIRKRDAYRT